MSRLQKKTAPTIIEPESFDEEEVVLEYQPEHPSLAFQAALKEPKPDHLEQYVEVDPFAKKEAVENEVAENEVTETKE